MAASVGGLLRAAWAALTGRRRAKVDLDASEARSSLPVGSPMNGAESDVPVPVPAASATAATVLPVEPPLDMAQNPPRRSDFRLSARLAAMRSLNHPSSRKNVPAPGIVGIRRDGSAPRAKSVPARRHVWLAAKHVAPARSGVVIPLPGPAERARRLARAA